MYSHDKKHTKLITTIILIKNPYFNGNIFFEWGIKISVI